MHTPFFAGKPYAPGPFGGVVSACFRNVIGPSVTSGRAVNTRVAAATKLGALWRLVPRPALPLQSKKTVSGTPAPSASSQPNMLSVCHCGSSQLYRKCAICRQPKSPGTAARTARLTLRLQGGGRALVSTRRLSLAMNRDETAISLLGIAWLRFASWRKLPDRTTWRSTWCFASHARAGVVRVMGRVSQHVPLARPRGVGASTALGKLNPNPTSTSARPRRST